MAVKGALGALVDLGALGAIHDVLSLLIAPHQDPTGCVARALRDGFGHNHGAGNVLEANASMMG